MPLTHATELDVQVVSRQLGRPARDIVAIAARCVCGNPLVVQTKPRLADGTPFPTLYYLTHPAATAAISTLEASGLKEVWSFMYSPVARPVRFRAAPAKKRI